MMGTRIGITTVEKRANWLLNKSEDILLPRADTPAHRKFVKDYLRDSKVKGVRFSYRAPEAAYYPQGKLIHVPKKESVFGVMHEAGHAVNANSMGKRRFYKIIDANNAINTRKYRGLAGLFGAGVGAAVNSPSAPYIAGALAALPGAVITGEEGLATLRGVMRLRKLKGAGLLRTAIPAALQMAGYFGPTMALPAAIAGLSAYGAGKLIHGGKQDDAPKTTGRSVRNAIQK